MDTRTIAIIAFIIAVVVLLLLVLWSALRRWRRRPTCRSSRRALRIANGTTG